MSKKMTVEEFIISSAEIECPNCDHIRAVNAELLESLGWFVTFHSGHVLPPELCNAMVKARNLLENNIG